MTELKIGDKITTAEQLRNLPVDTILKHLKYDAPFPLLWVKTNEEEWARNPGYDAISNEDLYRGTREELLTILDLPTPTNWKAGDTVRTVEETLTLPAGVICCSVDSRGGFALAKDTDFGEWCITGDDRQVTMSDMKFYLPLRILHLPDGGETDAQA